MSEKSLILSGCFCAVISLGCFAVVLKTPDIPTAGAAFAGAVIFGCFSAASFCSIKSIK